MKINVKKFRVPAGEKVHLKDWPTRTKPLYHSRQDYQEILVEHVEQMSARQDLLYADSRQALGRLASREWAQVGRFLGPSIRGFYERHPLDAIVGYWQQAGLQDVRVRRMSFGGGVIMSATRVASTGARED